MDGEDGWVDGCLVEWMDRWMDERKGGSMGKKDSWMDGWMMNA